MNRLRNSLRVQLLTWIVLTMAGTLCLNASFSFIQARETAELITDNMLRGSARMIAEAVHVTGQGGSIVDIPPAALEIFDTGHADRVYYRVTSAWGSLLAGYADLSQPPPGGSGATLLYRGEALRAISLDHPVVTPGSDQQVTVTVAITRNGLQSVKWSLFLSDLRNQVVLVAVAAAVTLVGLGRGLAPLWRLRDTVIASRGERLDPFDPGQVQTELRPLVGALNGYMARVQRQMAAQRRFVSNAAHQLRTPLALMATQAGFAAREADPQRRTEALHALLRSTRQIARLAEQLLTLSRAEPGSRRPRHGRIDMTQVVRGVLDSRAEKALRQGIDLGLEAGAPAPVSGDGTMLGEMVVNLVDNALHYTPAPGTVTVRVHPDGPHVVVTVSDTGPGIPEAERDQVFERFYRIAGTGPEGSGLGLAIVHEVASAAGGTVRLADAPGGGLTVTVTLPAAGPSSADDATNL